MARGIGDYSRAKLISLIDQRVSSEGGDITGVTAGTGLSGGGTRGDITLDLDVSELSALGATADATDYVIIEDATDNTTKKVLISNLPNNPAGSDNEIQFNNGGSFGAVSAFTWDDTNLKINDDTKLFFGTNSDAHIEYNEDGDDFLIISGSSKGMVLSGTTVQIAGTLVGASPLQIAGGIEVVSLEGVPTTAMSFGDDIKLYFGSDNDTYIQFKDGRGQHLEISGSNNGIVLSGSSVYVDEKLGIGIYGDDITHAITLPNIAGTGGQVKANAYITYSSARLKENITQIDNPIEILSNIKGVTFDWKENKKKDIGFIAEEVGKHLPHIVSWEESSSDAQGLDYNKLVPILVEAIKSQQYQIDSLETQIFLLKKQFLIKE